MKTATAGVEIKGAGGYVVAPGSRHPSGVIYEGELPPAADCPPVPGWLEGMLLQQRNGNGARAPRLEATIGAGARNSTLASVAGTMRRRGMGPDAIAAALKVENRDRCRPPLPDGDVERIAANVGRYEPAPVTATVLPAPSVPMAVAREFALQRFTDPDGCLTLRHWRGGWWRFETTRWVELERRVVRAWAYRFTEHADYVAGENVKPWAPNRSKISDLLEALAAVVHLADTVVQPGWIDTADPRTGVIVACANGLLDVGARVLEDHDPRFFNQTAVPFAYDAAAPAPEFWLDFLQTLWPGDPESVEALQEWFGYVISGRLDLHKILLLVGPTRGGKGAIARVLGALIGPENVAGPTLSSLATGFGLSTLIGKPLAVISDARLPDRGRGGSQTVVERLLAISGEDRVDVDRKYRDPWTGTLPSRFMVISNELPRLGDASAAIAGRMVALQLSQSWLGREDTTLEPRLHRELPGILNWALDGLERLTESGRFTRPASTDEAMVALADLACPVGAFVRDCCERGEYEIDGDALWKAWKEWAEDNGHGAGSKQMFGRDLRAAAPSRAGETGARWRWRRRQAADDLLGAEALMSALGRLRRGNPICRPIYRGLAREHIPGATNKKHRISRDQEDRGVA